MADETTTTTAKEPETEREPKRPPKKAEKVETPPPADDTNLPEYGPIIAEITPAGWFIFLGTLAVGVAIYVYVQRRRRQGKSLIPSPPQRAPRVLPG